MTRLGSSKFLLNLCALYDNFGKNYVVIGLKVVPTEWL